jgi:hypothetical protein
MRKAQSRAPCVATDIKVSTAQGTVDPALNAFTIYAWTSTTRNITNPYDLVFHLRPDDGKLAPANVKTVWPATARSESNTMVDMAKALLACRACAPNASATNASRQVREAGDRNRAADSAQIWLY